MTTSVFISFAAASMTFVIVCFVLSALSKARMSQEANV
ncbi:hypothetical protein JCM19239_6272 [Vibrio variabilis]|nr:hypothetical protein JCM19239_6272 [Vibrio variabilis]